MAKVVHTYLGLNVETEIQILNGFYYLQVYQSAQNMVDESHFAADEIKARIGHLKDHWTQLKSKCEQRRQDLEDSLQAHQYFSDAGEAEAFMKEKESLAGNSSFKINLILVMGTS